MKLYSKPLLICFIFLAFNTLLSAQKDFTKADSLKGGLSKERTWWDLKYYHLETKVNPEKKFISGSNTVQYKVLEPYQVMQIDLQKPMQIDSIVQNEKQLDFNTSFNAHFIQLKEQQITGAINELTIYYSGNPREAKNAPWDGGFTWAKDDNGQHFIATANQGIGASVWWPCKEHPADEPDSMLISVNVPKPLIDVSNGRLRNVEEHENSRTYHWFVSNPINNYGVNLNIGDYVNFTETYKGEKGILDCSYWVLSYNLEKAKKQFQEVPRMLKAFEYWFGPYPFYEDSYKLVEAPYLGMEHQSSVTYGNEFKNGYRGRDLSQTGWGLKFDFIIIHESGHEWFANNITNSDVADMWIHEGFTHYSENLFLDYHYDSLAANAYVQGVRSSIQNDRPIIGEYGLSYEGSGDMYYKGANMLHLIRQLFDNDEKWRQTLRGLNEEFYHQTVTTKEVENYISKAYGQPLNKVFDQYLRTTQIPTLTYRILGNQLLYKWENTVDGFNMPIRVFINGEAEWLKPNSKTFKALPNLPENADILVDPNFYVADFNLTE
ncbi:M1 family metallopeptidase [Marivirga sp.]|uniref:M1 family metallopeptidase n=1 Tax=Marivirga sp. TaxID=2018662 RepID=UPI002D7FE3E1|nr:M1 family metallopeptidase [Marivirga sp.]HET8861363.1 M1 family metallopeptidase [Marivirga sp.]